MRRKPPDVLITTPESLYLILTSQAREMLTGAEWVIVDEIHAVAQTKRGAHLALTLERLEALAEREVQRIGLSATQSPLEEVGRFLVGPRRTCTIVDTGSAQAARPEDPRARRVDGRTRQRRRHRFRCGRDGHHPPVDLARHLPRAARARPAAHLDDRLRQQPPRGRAPRPAPQRAPRERDRPRPPRLARPRGAAGGRGDAQVGRAAVPRGHVVAGAGHRHGRGRPRAPGRVSEVGVERPPAHRPRRPQRGRREQGPDLPQVPRRPARVRRRGQAHAGRGDRAHRRPAQPAGRAGPADRGHGRRGRGDRRRRPARPRYEDLHVLRSLQGPAGERPRHARRALSVVGVQRAAAPHRVGPRRRNDPRAEGRPPARHHECRDDPRPRPVRRHASRRPSRGRARRGDGLRGAPRPDVPAGRDDLADRGDRPRPRHRHAGAGRSRGRAVLEGRRRRTAQGAGSRDRRVLALGGRPARRGARARLRPRRARRDQPARLPARAAGGHSGRAERPHDRRRALPRRDRRLAAVRAVALRGAHPRRLGAGAERPHPGGLRAGVRRHLVGRRHHRPPPRRRRAAGRRAGARRAR